MKIRWNYIIFIIGLIFFIKIITSEEGKQSLQFASQINIFLLLLFLIVGALTLVVAAYRWKIILHSFGIEIPLSDAIKYKFAGHAINYLTPTARVGGEPLRAALLKKNKVDLGKATTSVIIDRFIEIFSTGPSLFIFATSFLVFSGAPLFLRIFIFIATGILTLLSLYLFYLFMTGQSIAKILFYNFKLSKYLNKRFRLKKIYDKIIEIDELIGKYFSEEFPTVVYTVFISFVMILLLILEYKIAYFIIGIDASFFLAFTSSFMTGLSYFASIPFSIGILDYLQIEISKAFAIQESIGIIIAMLVRFREIILSLIGLFILGHENIKLRSLNLKEEFFIEINNIGKVRVERRDPEEIFKRRYKKEGFFKF